MLWIKHKLFMNLVVIMILSNTKSIFNRHTNVYMKLKHAIDEPIFEEHAIEDSITVSKLMKKMLCASEIENQSNRSIYIESNDCRL
jgi:hypothetical protein